MKLLSSVSQTTVHLKTYMELGILLEASSVTCRKRSPNSSSKRTLWIGGSSFST
jgi:hypothetical protein